MVSCRYDESTKSVQWDIRVTDPLDVIRAFAAIRDSMQSLNLSSSKRDANQLPVDTVAP